MKLGANLFTVLILLVLLAAGILYYFVVLTSPIAFGDEGYYASLGRWVSENALLPKYEPYHETAVFHYLYIKAPFDILLNSFFWGIAGEAGIKIMIPLFALLAAAMVYLFFEKTEKRVGLAAAFILLMLPGFITYGVMDYSDALLVLLFTCSAYFGFESLESGDRKKSVLSGAFLAFAILTKVTAVFLVPLLIGFAFLKKFKQWKQLLLIFVVATVAVAPWFARNLVLFNGFCYPFLPGKCEHVADVNIPKLEGIDQGLPGPVAEVGTGAGIWKMGYIPYFNFAFGWTASILLVFGIAALIINTTANATENKENAEKRKKRDTYLFFAIWFALFVFLTIHQTFFGGRAEDVPRYTLFGFPAVAGVAGLFVADAYKFLKKYHKAIALMFVLIILATTWVYGQQKLTTMQQIRQKWLDPPGFIEGCKWVKQNTPKDSLVYVIYAHQGSYFCDRKAQSEVPDKNEIRLLANDTSYEHLKLHGYDYIMIEQFTVSVIPYGESTPLQFLQFLESSAHFKKVYDNTNVYGQSGVRIYEVLEA